MKIHTMVMVCIFIKMEKFMKEILKMDCKMEQVNLFLEINK